MAAKYFKLPVTKVHDANLVTVAQFLIASDWRAILHAIQISPQGATSATPPLIWEWGLQDTAGTAESANADIVKQPPAYSEDTKTTAQKNFTAEPATTTVHDPISLHAQSSHLWRPPFGPFVMLEETRWGLRYPAGQQAITVKYEFYLEE